LAEQKKRFGRTDTYNSSMSSHDTSALVGLSIAAQQILEAASDKLSLSARSYFKILKVARTIADMEESSGVNESHISEALQYRLKSA
jgi:magnesium chelatase family protein